MQLKMGRHLIFGWVCDPLGGNLHGWKVSIGVGWCPLPHEPNWHIKTLYSKHVGLFLLVWSCLCLGGGLMSSPNLGANTFHIWCPIWVGFSCPWRQGDSCVWLDRMDFKISMHMVLTPSQTMNVPKYPHVTFQLWGWWTSSKFHPKNPNVFLGTICLSTTEYYGKVSSYQEFVT